MSFGILPLRANRSGGVARRPRRVSDNFSRVNMKEFFKVLELSEVLARRGEFAPAGTENVELMESFGRILAEEIVSDVDIPDFNRSTMDGYAVRAASTFGASESGPAFLNLVGTVVMGRLPDFAVEPGEAARISTGGMLPEGADSVVMVEHTDKIADTAIEAYKSVAPGQNMIEKGEDIQRGRVVLSAGCPLRPQEAGLLAAAGKNRLRVFKKPVIGIISSGDEVVPVEQVPAAGQIRDMNSYTLAGQVLEAGGVPVAYGIARDSYDELLEKCGAALAASDMVLVSGGSSVGARDFTIDVFNALPDSRILVHGISISPGKPTILARSGGKPLFGLPGHVVSAMVVFSAVVRPFIDRLRGLSGPRQAAIQLPARMTRNVASAQGRVDYIRVRLLERDGELWAEPVLGKSGLIHTMVQADGLVAIGINTEGLDKGAQVAVMPI
jgi:molybdopterin molybdotransferase